MAGNPLAIFLFLGLGISALSVGPASLSETKMVIRSVPVAAARDAVSRVLEMATVSEVVNTLRAELGAWLDLSLFSERWDLSPLAGTV
jgi:phosphoenolpyruvate-protein kinase (PTS system EI component)